MSSNIDALKRAAEVALEKLQGKRYFVGDLSDRLREVADEYRQDTVIQAVSRVFDKMAQNNPMQIISQAEFDGVTQQLVGLNASGTKIREVLGDLFGYEIKHTSSSNEKYINGLRDNPGSEVDLCIDKKAQEEYSKLFETSVDQIDQKNAERARTKVSMELYSIGIDKARVRLAGGNTNFLVFAADLDTNRGMVRVLVPTEASGDRLPSVFVNGNSLEILSRANIKNYLENAVGNNSRLPAIETVLKSCAQQDICVPVVAVPEPLKSIASDFEDGMLETTVGYSTKSIELAKKMVVAELSAKGFKGSQVKVLEPMQDGFVCQATLNTPKGKVSIELPIEMNGQIPLIPSVFASGDFISDFTTASLNAFAMSNDSNSGVIHRDNPMFGMDIHQLKDVMFKAASQNDFNACDEILGVISESFDESTYRNVVADYQRILMNISNTKDVVKQAYDDSSQFVKTSTSMYPIHKKLGRPAHELVRDENGEYHLKSTYYARKNQEESSAFFSNAKVLVGD